MEKQMQLIKELHLKNFVSNSLSTIKIFMLDDNNYNASFTICNNVTTMYWL